MSTCTSCRATAATPETIPHDTYCPGRVFPHWVETHLPDSALDPAPEGWEDYERVNAAQHAAHLRAVCPHDDVEGDDNVPTTYTCRDCGDTWNGGAE